MDLYLLLYTLIRSALTQAVGFRHRENPVSSQIAPLRMRFALLLICCGEWPDRPALFVGLKVGLVR